MPELERRFIDEEELLPDPVIEAYEAGIDMTLLAENLKKTPEERLAAHSAALRALHKLRGLANR